MTIGKSNVIRSLDGKVIGKVLSVDFTEKPIESERIRPISDKPITVSSTLSEESQKAVREWLDKVTNRARFNLNEAATGNL